MPSCLIELGFISTPDEERLLNNNTSIDNIARGIYNAFVAYKRTYNNTGITYSPEEPSAYPDAGDAAKARKDKTASRDTGSLSKSKRGSKAKASNDAEGYGDAENAVSPIETPQPATTAMPKASILPILPTIPEASAQPAPPAMTISGAQQTQPDMPMTGMQQTQPIMPMASAQPTQPVMPMVSMQPAQQAMPRTYIQPAPPAPANNSGITFKVQIFVSDIALKPNDARFKRRRDVDNYQEGGMVKYTIGSSANYNEMEKLRRELDPSFHGCFVIAFKNGNKMNINEAIREWRNGRRQ
jgi:N-acetylmuramoyl-L-alanine amidase